MRGEELCRGRDVLGRDLLVFLETREDLILLFRDVELVEPAYDLDITFLHTKCLVVTLSAES